VVSLVSNTEYSVSPITRPNAILCLKETEDPLHILPTNVMFILFYYNRQHQSAARVAIKATKLFFDGIRKDVGDQKFAKFLNMEALRTLSFAIDTTGSMSGKFFSRSRYSFQKLQVYNCLTVLDVVILGFTLQQISAYVHLF
jgi:hypothetical protein